MNRRPTGLTISKAIPGFINYKSAEGLSPNSLASYERDLIQWLTYQKDIDIGKVTSRDIRDYLNYLRVDYKPRRITGNNDKKLSPKTIRNIWVTMASFFRWASIEFEISNPVKQVPAPKFTVAPVEPFSKNDIEILIKACDYCEEAQTNYRQNFKMRRSTAKRDRALILTLLDLGLRASELCSLTINDVDLKKGKVIIKHGVGGGAKGGKGRIVYLGKVARRTLWRYLAEREDGEEPGAPVFLTKYKRPMNKSALLQIINALGAKAGVDKCHPHRFRHTFAITYLRAGGDVFTLQMLLGHSTLDMVKRYVKLSGIDMENAHRKASPVDNWRL